MSLLACILSAVAATCLYAAIAHLVAGVRDIFRGAHLTFAVLAALIALHAFAHIDVYTSTSQAEYMHARTLANLSGAIAMMLVPWLAHFYAGARRMLRPLVLSGLYLFCVVSYELAPFERDIPQVERLLLPWGEYATIHRLPALPFELWLFWIVNGLCVGYVALLCMKMYVQGRRWPAIAMAFSIAVLMASLFANTLILLSKLDAPFLGEFGFGALILVMLVSLSNDDGYRTLIAQARVGIFLSTPAGRIISANDAGGAMLGFSPGEMRGLCLAELAAPEEINQVPTQRDALARGDALHTVLRLRRKDGAALVADVAAQALTDGRLLHIVRDVTEEMRVQRVMELLAVSGPAIDHRAFAQNCTETLARAFNVRHAVVGTLDREARAVRPIATFSGEDRGEYAIESAPCRTLAAQRPSVFIEQPAAAFPHHPAFERSAVASYLSAAIFSAKGEVIGVVEVWDEEAFAGGVEAQRILEMIAHRLGAEMERAAADAELRQLAATLEARVAERTAELAALNRQLEAFAYSVSHDLRAPVRTIGAQVQMLMSSDALEPSQAGRLQRIRAAVKHMSELIEGLLKLATLPHQSLVHTPTDLSALAREAMHDIEERTPGRTIEFVCAENLQVVADRSTLRVVIGNLLENAWKYSACMPCARIELGRRWDHGEWVYYVRDNGVGFDMRYAQHLFEPFRRLHSSAEFPGTGIGLATVANIVRRYGGRIWAQSAPGEGATFYFTLGPSADPIMGPAQRADERLPQSAVH